MKITPKLVKNFLASEAKGLDGIGFNDAWNLATYGMTRADAAAIRRAMTDVYGMRFNWPKNPSLSVIQARL